MKQQPQQRQKRKRRLFVFPFIHSLVFDNGFHTQTDDGQVSEAERRRVTYLTKELMDTIEMAKKETDLLQQTRLTLIDEATTQRHCQGGSRVEKVQLSGMNPRFIPLDKGTGPSGYLNTPNP